MLDIEKSLVLELSICMGELELAFRKAITTAKSF